MTDIPILFSGPMVRAILREILAPGTGKTQTRRLLKPQPALFEVSPGRMCDVDIAWDTDDGRGRILKGCDRAGVLTTQTVPYAPGDRLWVRETWAAGACSEGLAPSQLSPRFYGPRGDNGGVWYAAGGDPAHPVTPRGAWRPSIHMPRWASRLTLSVASVRLERLQAISEGDARAEGAERMLLGDEGDWYLANTGTYRTGFAGLWTHVAGGYPGGAWDDNPWVVAVTFAPALRNIDTPTTGRDIAGPAPDDAAQRHTETAR